MKIDTEAQLARTADRHRRNLASLADATKRLKEHNDELEEKMRERGSVPPPPWSPK